MVRGGVSLGVEATGTGLRFESVVYRSNTLRQEQRFVDRSHVASTKAILEDVTAVVCRQEQEQCRQERCFVDKGIVLSTRAIMVAIPTTGAA